LENKDLTSNLKFNMLGRKKSNIKMQDKDINIVRLNLKSSLLKNNINKKEEQKNKP
jgi:hypothetical protein